MGGSCCGSANRGIGRRPVFGGGEATACETDMDHVMITAPPTGGLRSVRSRSFLPRLGRPGRPPNPTGRRPEIAGAVPRHGGFGNRRAPPPPSPPSWWWASTVGGLPRSGMRPGCRYRRFRWRLTVRSRWSVRRRCPSPRIQHVRVRRPRVQRPGFPRGRSRAAGRPPRTNPRDVGPTAGRHPRNEAGRWPIGSAPDPGAKTIPPATGRPKPIRGRSTATSRRSAASVTFRRPD